MASARRSARLDQRQCATAATDSNQVGSHLPVSKAVEKGQNGAIPVGNTLSARGVGKRSGKAHVRAGSASAARQGAQAQYQMSSGSNSPLHALPPEILRLVLDNMKDPRSISALGRTCKAFYSMMMPRLYRRVAVAAMFHAHIPRLIRTLKPLLTIAQKKQLQRGGKYRGQLERYPAGLDEQAKPFHASHVQQLVVGVVDPGEKHRYIVERYVEEMLKNLDNLEIVETRVLTRSVAESLASLKSLKALSLFSSDAGNEDMTPLAEIKNLKHLSLENINWASTSQRRSMQSMIQNSTRTLESLKVDTHRLSIDSHLLVDWVDETLLSAAASEEATLRNLKSLTLSCYRVEPGFTEALHNAIDFTKLTDLTIDEYRDDSSLLFRKLAALAGSSYSLGTRLSLRHLCLSMGDVCTLGLASEKITANLEAKHRFVSSFDTLQTLTLRSYGQYPERPATPNPGLADTTLQAILGHRNLTTLRIAYSGNISSLAIPYLSARNVRALVDGLPRLRNFEFAPDEEQMDEIGQALARGSDLASITCFPHNSWGSYPLLGDGVNILSGITKAFLNYPGPSDPCPSYADADVGSRSNRLNERSFMWDDNYRLRRVSVCYRTWELASEFFGKGEKGTKPPKQMDSEDGSRWVWYRDVTETSPVRIHVGYDPEFSWLEKVGG